MALNEIQITDFVLEIISPFLSSRINGKTYHKGHRPTDSNKEDAVIVFSNADASQIQNGFVYINIYCKNIDCGVGHKVDNRGRLRTFLSWGNDLVSLLNMDYRFRWVIEEQASKIFEEPQTEEHFASIKLRFSYLNK